MAAEEGTVLQVLHVSDIHTGYPQIEKLKQWVKDNRVRIDVVLVSGDLTEMPMDPSLPHSEVEKFEKDFTGILSALGSLCPHIVYIPGNHDPLSFFAGQEELRPLSLSSQQLLNVHNRVLRLRPDLFVVGFGGSIPVFKDGKQFWWSFPHVTEEAYAEEMKPLLEAVFQSESTPLSPNDSVILMVHNGPQGSSTSVDFDVPESPTFSGVKCLGEFLKSPPAQSNIFITLHGHTHKCSGKAQIGGITVSNPGALKEGRFAMYTIERGPVHPENTGRYLGLWAATSLAYHTLQ